MKTLQTRKRQLILLLTALLASMSLLACGQSTGVAPPASDVTTGSPVALTRTAEAVAVQTIDAALAAEETTPAPGSATVETVPSQPPSSVVVVVTATPALATDTLSPPLPTHTEPPPTLTPTPLPTDTPTPLPCSLSVHRQLAAAWNRSELGCPQTQAGVIWAAWQPFEGGYMLWRSDTQQMVVFYNDRTWARYPDQWTEGIAIPSRGSPPAGRVAPVRGFGYVWATHDEVANRLGWALTDEQGFCTNIQSFERGFIFHSSTVLHCQGDLYNWATHPEFTPLFFSVHADGRWERY